MRCSVTNDLLGVSKIAHIKTRESNQQYEIRVIQRVPAQLMPISVLCGDVCSCWLMYIIIAYSLDIHVIRL